MHIVYQRHKCIGCNYCSETDPENWVMSKKDGKSNLIGSKEQKNHYILKVSSPDMERISAAVKNCPVHIIKIMP